MTTTTLSLVDRLALLAALNKFCQCEHGEIDELLNACPGHKEFSENADRFANRMGWGRWFARRLVFEEWNLRNAA